MAERPTDEELKRFHKWFGAEANNRCWNLCEQKERTHAEVGEMLDTAHVSAYHWRSIGTELNNKRAAMLLGLAYALANVGDLALQYARESFDYFTTTQCPDWELAFAYAILANAQRAAGQLDDFAISYARAAELGNAIADDEDKSIFMASFSVIPTP